MVHARRLGDRTLDFGVSGSLWNDALVMYDRQTRSLWSHVTGECLEGALAKSRLTMLPATLSTFGEWVALYPATRVLAKPPGEGIASEYEKYATSAKQGIFGTRAQRDELPPKAIIQGVARDGKAVALSHAALVEGVPLSFALGGQPFFAIRSRGAVRVYERRIASSVLRLDVTGDGDVRPVRDRVSGTIWNAETGEGVSGPLAGHALAAVPSTTSYWFAWLNFYPRSRVVK